MQALAEYAGRLARCPACGDNVIIPGPSGGRSTAVRPDRPSPPKKVPPPADYEEIEEVDEVPAVEEVDEVPRQDQAAAAEHDDFDENGDFNEDDDRPRSRIQGNSRGARPKKGGRGRVLLWVSLTTLAVLLIGGGGALAWWLYPAPGVTDDLVFVPANPRGIVSVRLGDIAESAVGKQLISQLPLRAQGSLFVPDPKLQINPEDLERITVVFPAGGNSEPGWGIFRAKKPFDRAEILDNLANATTKEHEGKTYYKPARRGEPIYFAGDNIVVIASNEAMMKKALSLPPGRSAGSFSSALKMMDAKRHFVAALAVTPDMVQFPKMMAGGALPGGIPGRPGAKADPAAKQLEAIFDLQSLTVVADAGERLDIEVDATYPDEAAAKKVVDGVQALIKTLQPGKAPGGAKQPGGAQGMMGRMQSLLDNITLEQASEVVHLRLSLDQDTLDGFANAGPGIMPRQPPMPNGPGEMRPSRGGAVPPIPLPPGARWPGR
jgi:hypothetical protein